MLTPEQIDGVILAGSYRNAAGGIYTTCTEYFAHDIETLATAEARALVGQMLQALDHYAPREQVTAATLAARAWLGEAQKGDGHG